MCAYNTTSILNTKTIFRYNNTRHHNTRPNSENDRCEILDISRGTQIISSRNQPKQVGKSDNASDSNFVVPGLNLDRNIIYPDSNFPWFPQPGHINAGKIS